MPKIVNMGSGRLKTDISVEIWKSKIFMITILPLYKEVKIYSLATSRAISRALKVSIAIKRGGFQLHEVL
ncbi:hypothetical protein O3M35_001849 [Rhynocoris fuscipes]|uniref:Uncharacterized protein n=1 Tax=Rhynocoris fuscipes TaxID=488301 RepID=A0AAW1CPV2_9HEMI